MITQKKNLPSKIIKYNLISLGLVMALSAILVHPNALLAQEETATNQEATSSSSTTRNLRERIDRIVEEKREQIKGVLSELDIQKRAVIGEITRVTEESITIRNHKGTEIISIENEVALLEDGDPIAFDEIAVGNWLLALGVMEDETFSPLRISISEDTLRPRPRVVLVGTISEVNRSSIVVTSRDGSGDQTFELSSDTRYLDLEGEPLDEDSLRVDTQAFVAGFVEEDEDGSDRTQEASVIQILTTQAALADDDPDAS